MSVAITTILDARGDFTYRPAGVSVNANPPPGHITIARASRIYTFAEEEFPEFAELERIFHGEDSAAIVESVDGSRLSPDFHDRVWLRFEEARALAWSMTD